MPIGHDSPLRLLPANLDRRQMLFFDGIRVATEMAESAYHRLAHSLQQAATNTIAPEDLPKLVPLCFLDAWSIVDSTNRLRVLLQRLPRFKQRAPSLQLFYRRTEGVVPLRNSVQHLDGEIDRLARDNYSVWGTLTWMVLMDAQIGRFTVGTLASGTQFGGAHPLPNPAGISMHSTVDHVTLVAGGLELDLSEVVRSIVEFIQKLEGVIAPQSSGHAIAPSDFLILAEMVAAHAQDSSEPGNPAT